MAKSKMNRKRAPASLERSFQRTLAKINCRIHTDAIKERLIPPQLTKAPIVTAHASEADLLNVALFGMTVAQCVRPIPNCREICAMWRRWSNSSCCPIWRASTLS
jgi:hypothetical protein